MFHALFFLSLLADPAHAAETTTIRSPDGRTQGYVTREGSHVRRIDPQGRTTARQEIHRDGSSTVYDTQGRVIARTTTR